MRSMLVFIILNVILPSTLFERLNVINLYLFKLIECMFIPTYSLLCIKLMVQQVIMIIIGVSHLEFLL